MKSKVFVWVILFAMIALFPSTAYASQGNEDLSSVLDLLNGLLQPVLVIVLPVLAGAAITWAVGYWQKKSAELSERHYLMIRWIVSAGVWAAEQAWMSNGIPKNQREQYALRFVQRMADTYKIKINVSDLYVLIKARVAEELNKSRILDKPAEPRPDAVSTP